MSILSRCKASLRGSQPFPDLAAFSQPPGSVPLSSAAASLGGWGLGFLFSALLHCFGDQVAHVSYEQSGVCSVL